MCFSKKNVRNFHCLGRPKHYWHYHIKGYHGKNLGITNSDGPTWTEQRRFALKHLKDLGFGRKSLDAVTVEEADQVIDSFLNTKDGIIQMKNNFNAALINVIWQIVASKKFDPEDEQTKYIIDLMKAQSKNRYSKIMFFPTLFKILPFREVDKKLFELKAIMERFVLEHKETIDYDNPRDFIDVYLSQMKLDDNFNEEQLVVECLDFFEAGAETTSTTLLWAVLMMCLNPNVQAKCQSEVQEKIGSRSPTIDDIVDLPYVLATLMEIQRIGIVGPASLPHYLMKDTLIKGNLRIFLPLRFYAHCKNLVKT